METRLIPVSWSWSRMIICIIYSSWLINYISHHVQQSFVSETTSNIKGQEQLKKFQTQTASISELERTFISKVLKT